jgi:hypothetical protein
VLFAALYVTAPAIGVVLGPVTRKVEEVIVAGSMGLLKATVIFVPMGTLVTPHDGASDRTVGGTGSAVVVKLHAEVPVELTPSALFAAELTATLNNVLNARLAVGLKVATRLVAS